MTMAFFVAFLVVWIGHQQSLGTPFPKTPPPIHCDSQWTCNCAIILPMADKRTMTRQGYKLTDSLNGVRFDLDGDGIEEQTSWTAQHSHLAFLALDRNGNGKIDNGKELYGNHTFPGVGSGFAALLRDSNKSGLIREGVPLYEKLLLWEDENHNGPSEPWELHKFSDEYVGLAGSYIPVSWAVDNNDRVAIERFVEHEPLVDENGNEFRFQGTATVRDPGKSKKYPMDDRGAELDSMIPIYDVTLRGR
jgi:hypothetical protein